MRRREPCCAAPLTAASVRLKGTSKNSAGAAQAKGMPWGNWASTISTSVSSRVDASAGMRRAQKCTDCGTSPTRPRRSLAQAERQTLKSLYYSRFPKLLFAYCAARYPWPAEFAKVGRRGDAVAAFGLVIRCQEPLRGQTLRAAPCWHWQVAWTLKARVLFALGYGCGLHASEVVRLKVGRHRPGHRSCRSIEGTQGPQRKLSPGARRWKALPRCVAMVDPPGAAL